MRYCILVPMSNARNILSNTFIQIGGKIMMALVSVFIVKMITKFLSVEGYGQYVSVYEFLAFFGIMADLGLFTIAVREMAKEEEKKEFILGNILTLRTLLATTAMLLASAAAFLIPQYDGTYIPVGVAIASIAVFFSIIQGTVSSILQVNLKMQYPTLGLVLGKLVTVGYMVYVVYYGFTEPSAQAFYHLLWAGVLGNGLMLLVTIFFASKYATIRFRFDFEYWKATLWRTLPYGLALVLNMVYFRIDSIMLLFLKNTTEVGLYGVPMRILDILSIIPVYFMNSVLPILTRQLKENVGKAKETVQHAFDFLMVLAMPIVVGAQVLAYPLIFVISSPEFLSRLDEGFYGSDIALKILVFAMLFSFISSAFTFTLIAIGNQSKLLYISAVGAVFNIVANFLVIPTWGFRGAAFTSVLSEIIVVTLAYLMLRRHFPVRLRFGGSLKVVLSAVVMGVAVWALRDPTYALMQNFNVLALTPIGGIVYGIMLWVTGVISKERLQILRRKPPMVPPVEPATP